MYYPVNLNGINILSCSFINNFFFFKDKEKMRERESNIQRTLVSTSARVTEKNRSY